MLILQGLIAGPSGPLLALGGAVMVALCLLRRGWASRTGGLKVT